MRKINHQNFPEAIDLILNKINHQNFPEAIDLILNKINDLEIEIRLLKNEMIINKNIPFIDNEPYVHGITGLAKFLNITPPTAQKIKNSGKLPFTQVGRTIMFKKKDILNLNNL